MPEPLTMLRTLILSFMLLLSTACATNAPNGPIYDPLEPLNRKVYAFNNVVDRTILKPAARGYLKVTPSPVRKGVRNFFSNLDDVTVLTNDLLQLKFKQAASDASRILVNSTLGLGGLIDWGTPMGLPKNFEYFGQTFGVWGMGEGPYLVLPIFGPNNFRGTAGLVTEIVVNVNPTREIVIPNETARSAAGILDIVSLGAEFIDSKSLLDEVALDPYQTARAFWVLRHRTATWDGKKDVQPRSSAPSTRTTDELDQLDELDELDELDRLDELDELDRLDELDELDQLDELDELDRLDELDAS